MFRIRARPEPTWRCTRRVFSFDRSPPMTGMVMVRRSGSSRMAPVVNRTRSWSRRADLKRGKPHSSALSPVPSCWPTSWSARSPGRPGRWSRPLSSSAPTTAPPRPWPGSTPCATRPGSTATDSCSGLVRRASRSDFTSARPQLNALRRAPKCERTSRTPLLARQATHLELRTGRPSSRSAPTHPTRRTPHNRPVTGIQLEQHRHRLHRRPVGLEISTDIHIPRQRHRTIRLRLTR